MIFITGDVHNDIAYAHPCRKSLDESAAALKYARIAEEVGVNVTLFVTGRVILERTEAFRSLSLMGNVELGGHGWDSFCNRRMRTLLWSLCGSRHGPGWYQAAAVARTFRAFGSRLGVRPATWRHHAYYTDEHSYAILKKAGVKVVSDRVVGTPFNGLPWAHQSIQLLESGLWSLPINTAPDHDSIVHGGIGQAQIDIAAETFRKSLELRGPPGRKRHAAVIMRRVLRHAKTIEVLPWSGENLYAGGPMILRDQRQWEHEVLQQIVDRISAVGFATLLLHPACMEVLDGMGSLRRIMRFCRQYDTRVVGDVWKQAVAKSTSNCERAAGRE